MLTGKNKKKSVSIVTLKNWANMWKERKYQHFNPEKKHNEQKEIHHLSIYKL